MELSAGAPPSQRQKKFQVSPRARARTMPLRPSQRLARKDETMAYIFFMKDGDRTKERAKKGDKKYCLPAGLYHIKYLFVQAFSGKNFYARQCALRRGKLLLSAYFPL
jgi:hypothetical protein